MIYGNDTKGFCEQCEDVLVQLKANPVQLLKDAREACKEMRYFTPRICDEEYRIYAGEQQMALTGFPASIWASRLQCRKAPNQCSC